MGFNNWKEAEARATEIKTELEQFIADLAESETAALDELISVEERDKLITAIQAKVTKRDALQRQYDDVIKERDMLKASEERQFGLLSNLGKNRVEDRMKASADHNVYETRSYELAWANYIKTGNDAEARDLINTQDSGGGGLLVPKTLADKIEDTMRKGGRLINLCDTISVKGITEYPVALDRSDPELHKEVTAGTAAKKKGKSITLTSVKMDPQFIAEIMRTTRKFEADGVAAFWDWLMAELPDALRRVIDKMILSGGQGGTDGIHGILTNTKKDFVEILKNHALNFNTANMAVALLDDGVEDNVTAVMNRQTFFNNVMGLKGLDDHPIWQQVMTSNMNKPAFMMGGYPVVFSSELPAYDEAQANEPYMVVGNFNAMKLNFPEGMNVQITRDAITEMEQNVVRYLSEIYVAGNITKVGSFVKVTK